MRVFKTSPIARKARRGLHRNARGETSRNGKGGRVVCADQNATVLYKVLQVYQPRIPKSGRMSSVEAKPPRFGVSSVFFQGIGLPYMGRPWITR
jgi:hypothetical protein